MGASTDQTCRPGALCVLMADTNGRVGSCCSDSIGDACPDFENANGAAFHALAVLQCLWLPATFPECIDTSARQHTFQATTGGCKSIDFIALDQAIPAECCKAWVELSLDMAAKRIDHLPVASSCWVVAKGGRQRQLGGTQPCCNRGRLVDPG